MSREVPTSKQATLWRANGHWFQRRDAAYYALAKAIVCRRYPPWLDTGHDDKQRDELAEEHGIADWRARRDRAVELFWDDGGAHFRADRWQRFIRRLAKFLKYVDDRRSELIRRTGGLLDPRDALELEQRVSKICREWAASIGRKNENV